MTIFSCTNISKSYNQTTLFEKISFGMQEGERTGLIGRNGVGKTTLMRIIAGIEVPDEGNVAFNSNLRFEYLTQLPSFTHSATAIETVMSGKPEIFSLLTRHTALCNAEHTPESETELAEITHSIDLADGWSLESEAKMYLQKLGVVDFHDNVQLFSGGFRKRVALARALLSEPDLLILDEPTNHLDADSVQWLQDRLQNSTKALFLVTHDRYFLDAVANRIVELDRGKIFTFGGSYEYYLEKKEAAIVAEEAAGEHLRNKLRTELAWLQRGAKARRTKQQSRIDWIAKMQSTPKNVELRAIKIELGGSSLGSKVIDAINIGKNIGERDLFKNFNYSAAGGDRIGIIGANGSGKSTLLKTFAGEIQPDSGTVKIGSTVKIGFFRQENAPIPPTQTVIGALRDIAEYIDVGVGRERYISAKELLDRFLFPPKQQFSHISTLSGGERRRLELLRVLMGNPNVLLLDEPTNDFDIATLGALEEYLEDFTGCLIIVSHDRSFLDKTVSFIYAFEEGGKIKQYPGNYSAYLEKKEAEEQRKKIDSKNDGLTPQRIKEPQKKKLSYKEQKEFESLESEIEILEEKKSTLENALSSASGSDYKKNEAKSKDLAILGEKIEIATLRWLELGEKMVN